MQPRVIGGIFGLSDMPNPNSTSPPFLNDRATLLVNASSGIWLVVELLSPPQVWMPSFLCDSMLKAVDAERTVIRFYDVTYDLAVTSFCWLEDVQPNDLVVAIDYFGFPCDESLITRAKAKGAFVLEDACQALLSEGVGRFSDFVLFSPRKFLGVPDGGILISNHQIELGHLQWERPPASWWLKALSVGILRREFDLNAGSRRWFELYQETEADFPIGSYAMSELSEMLLKQNFDYSMIAQQRIRNYEILAEALGSIALFPKLPPKVVPLGFPIRVRNRDQTRQVLFDDNIFPPVHWKIPKAVPITFRDSHRLSAEIMTLPCDQRYDKWDMEEMAHVVHRGLG